MLLHFVGTFVVRQKEGKKAKKENNKVHSLYNLVKIWNVG